MSSVFLFNKFSPLYSAISSFSFKHKSNFLLLYLCRRHFLIILQVISGVQLFILICQSSLESSVSFKSRSFLKDKLWLYRRPFKILPQFENTFFLCNLVGYLEGYCRKLLLLFDTDHLAGKLPYFDNCNVIYLLMASFLGYFLLWLVIIVFMLLVQL